MAHAYGTLDSCRWRAIEGLMARRCAQQTVARISLYLAVLIGAVGVGSLYAGEEVIILGKGKTQTLAEWNLSLIHI